MIMTVLLESEPLSGIVQWVMNRPQMRNALDSELVGALRNRIAFHAHREQTRVIVLRAAGAAFCAGLDLKSMLLHGQAPEADNRAEARAFSALLSELRELPKPTVAVVQGPTFGGGVGLVAACDVAIGAEEAKFCLSEVRLGLVPAIISPYLIEAIGVRQFRRYGLSGEMMGAERAQVLGLLHEVVPTPALGGEALRLATDLAQGGPIALRECKALIAGRAQDPYGPERDTQLADWLARLRSTEEAQTGIAAMLARRPPPWTP
jgi:methylglutaconyl-CoA hydratase